VKGKGGQVIEKSNKFGIATNRTIQRVDEKCVLEHNLLQPIL
jgi:hypothetical protein